MIGDDILARVRSDLPDAPGVPTLSQYHYDGLGTTRALSGPDGDATDATSYYGFGETLASAGNTPNTLLFTGEQYDPNLGFYHLRARYYDPANGRFASLDPFVGDPMMPMSLHKYLYAHARPIIGLDPSGMMTFSQFLVGVGVIGLIIDSYSMYMDPSLTNGIMLAVDLATLPWWLIRGTVGGFKLSASVVNGFRSSARAASIAREQATFAYAVGRGYVDIWKGETFLRHVWRQIGTGTLPKFVDFISTTRLGRWSLLESKTAMGYWEALQSVEKFESTLAVVRQINPSVDAATDVLDEWIITYDRLSPLAVANERAFSLGGPIGDGLQLLRETHAGSRVFEPVLIEGLPVIAKQL